MSVFTLLNTIRISLKCTTTLPNVRSCSSAPLPANSTNKTEENQESQEDVKDKILSASLPFVTELSWSKEALAAGANSLGLPGVTHGLFPNGGADLVHYFQIKSNAKLTEILKECLEKNKDTPLPPSQFVENACKERLQMIEPYLSKWPQAIAIMSLPPNVPNALATLLTMVDDICYYAGDRSVDHNWYLRRIGVAGVYKSTELYLIQDKSPNHEETWKFLNRRLKDAVQLQEFISKSDSVTQGAREAAMSAFVSARNILGLNWNR